MHLAVSTPLLLHLTSSLLINTLRIIVETEVWPTDDNYFKRNQTVFVLISPKRHMTFSTHRNYFYIDNFALAELKSPIFALNFICLSNSTLYIELVDYKSDTHRYHENDSLFCISYKDLLVGPHDTSRSDIFYGCVEIYEHESSSSFLSGRRWCRQQRKSDGNKLRRSANELSVNGRRVVGLGERLQVREGGSSIIQTKNIYLLPEPKIHDFSDIVTEPEFGKLVFTDPRHSQKGLANFTYNDIARKWIEYRHDGSESTEDSFDFTAYINLPNSDDNYNKSFQHHNDIYTIFIDIEPVDDPPQLEYDESRGPIISLAPGANVKFTENYLRIWDVDTPTQQVTVEVQSANGIHLRNRDRKPLKRFSLAQFLNGEIFLTSDGGNGEISFIARDASGGFSSPITLRATSVAVALHFGTNTGLKIPHRSSRPISRQNLSFYSNFAEIPIKYSIVDQPKFGIIECVRRNESVGGPSQGNFAGNVQPPSLSDDGNEFELCSEFEQSDIDAYRIHYRHLSANRPQSDSFSFQVRCAEATSTLQIFHINFIPVSVRVFTQEPLTLNNTERGVIGQRNLLSTTFPHHFAADQLVYHVVEPPKFGTLTREIQQPDFTSKFRRIGVSSNFTQEHVDNNFIVYKLHFLHYSIVNDFFLFRLITPAVTSELLRFEITYIPSPNSIHLINRTLIATEGTTQQITNNTLWLETPDDSNFLFTIGVPMFNGRLILVNELGAKFYLDIASSFTSSDIVNKRLFYEHSDDETRTDRAYLVAESVYRRQTRISLWLTVSIVRRNDNPPKLLLSSTTDELALPDVTLPLSVELPHHLHHIYLIRDSERILHPSLIPWYDPDEPLDGGARGGGNAADASGASRSTSTDAGSAAANAQLQYHFMELFKDFIICKREFPELSVRNFTQRELQDRVLIVRHLNVKKDYSKLKYMVSDGVHSVVASLMFVASAPFVSLNREHSRISLPLEPDYLRSFASHFHHFLLITVEQLSASTNVDTDLEAILFEGLHSRATPFNQFRILEGGRFVPAERFRQRDIRENRLFFKLDQSFFLLTDDADSPTSLPNTIRITIPMRITAVASPHSLASGKARQLFNDVAFVVELDLSRSGSALDAANALPIVLRYGLLAGDASPTVQLTLASSTTIDSGTFGVLPMLGRGSPAASDVKFHLNEAPHFGSLILQQASPKKGNRNITFSLTPNNFLLGFRQSDLNAGRLMYIGYAPTSGARNSFDVHDKPVFDGRDAFSVNISLPFMNQMIDAGPFRVEVKLIDSKQMTLVVATNLSMELGRNITLSARDLLLLIPDDVLSSYESWEYRIMHVMPRRGPLGRLVLNRRVDDNLEVGRQVLSTFSHRDLLAGNVVFVSDRINSSASSNSNNLFVEYTIRACAGPLKQSRCSASAKLRIHLHQRNKFGPKLIRNEVLSVPISAKDVILSHNYLKAVDQESLPTRIKYLVWHSSGGHLVKLSAANGRFTEYTTLRRKATTALKPIQSFTQFDLDNSLIAFVFVDNSSLSANDEKTGFSFLVSDGLHQTGAEWFSIRRTHPSAETTSPLVESTHDADERAPKVELESNARLNVAPGISSTISSDFLKATVENTPAAEILFHVTRQPLHGKLSLEKRDGSAITARKPLTHFSQAEIDAGELVYRSADDLGAWSQRDSFNFAVVRRADHFRLTSSSAENGGGGSRPGDGKVLAKGVNEFRFRIAVSYANVDVDDLSRFISSDRIFVGSGGSVALNASHLNLTRLSALCDDVLFVHVDRWPKYGVVVRISDELSRNLTSATMSADSSPDPAEVGTQAGFDHDIEEDEEEDDNDGVVHDPSKVSKTGAVTSRPRMPLKWEEFLSGRSLIYRNNGSDVSDDFDGSRGGDAWMLCVYPLRERHRRQTNCLKVTLKIVVGGGDGSAERNERIESFTSSMELVSGGTVMLSPKHYQITHSSRGPTELLYRVVQPPTTCVRLFQLAESGERSTVVEFSQAQVNKGQIGVEHLPLASSIAANGSSTPVGKEIGSNLDYDLIGFRVGDWQTRVLTLRIEPLALRLLDHSTIRYVQGKSYVVLNRTHLGAESNGDRAAIVYNITRPPVNGSFYWVADERQTHLFTQKNIDDGEVLYSQLNMNAFRDSFSFVLENEEMILLERSSTIEVLPAVKYSTFFIHSRTIARVSTAHLNCSIHPELIPFYVVVRPSKFGVLFLGQASNVSTAFFTHSDVVNGNLFFHAFDIGKYRVEDEFELELAANSVQPARFRWPVEILPADDSAIVSASSDYGVGRAKMMAEPPGRTVKSGGRPAINRSIVVDTNGERRRLPHAPPEIDYRFPVFILVGVVGAVVAMALFRWKSASRKERDESKSSNNNESDGGERPSIPGIGPLRALPPLDDEEEDACGVKSPANIFSDRSSPFPLEGVLPLKAMGGCGPRKGGENLLDSTVYASLRHPLSTSGNTKKSISGSNSSTLRHHQRQILPIAEEDPAELRKGATVKSVRLRDDSVPIMAVNPATMGSRQQQQRDVMDDRPSPLKKLILPSRRPVAVSAVVPTFATFESSGGMTTDNNYEETALNDTTMTSDGSVFSPTVSAATTTSAFPIGQSPPSAMAARQQQTQLAAAVVAAMTSRQQCGSVTVADPMRQLNVPPIRRHSNDGSPSSSYENNNEENAETKGANMKLKENQYWV